MKGEKDGNQTDSHACVYLQHNYGEGNIGRGGDIYI